MYIKKKHYHVGKEVADVAFVWHPMIFQLEHLSLIKNTVKHIYFQDHMQEINAFYQSYIIYLLFSFLADLNSVDTTFAKCT